MKTRMPTLQLAGLALIIGAAAGAFASDGGRPGPQTDVLARTNGPAVPDNTFAQPGLPIQKPIATNSLATAQSLSQRLSPWASQVRKLALAGVDEDIVLSYIDGSGTFNLTAEQIISLTQSGVPRTIITAMIQHDSDIAAGVRQVLPSTVPDLDVPLFPPAPKGTLAAAPAPRRTVPPWDDYVFPPHYAPDFVLEPLDDLYQPLEMKELSPVRKPYPVQLTAPILVWPTEGRMPNTVLLQPFH
jgi:hypothetical protein